MKKILSTLLVAAMLCAMFVMPSAAASDLVNTAADVPFLETAPNVDGTVDYKEYGTPVALHTFAKNPTQYTDDGTHNKLDNIDDVEFYIGWTADSLHMAWVVTTDEHTPFPKGTYVLEGDYAKMASEDWPATAEEQAANLKYMWYFSCVQFIITPGAPTAGTTSYENDKNFLSIGFCEMNDGSIGKALWNTPRGIDASDFDYNDWDAAVVRDGNTTTYEIAIPAEMCGVSSFGTDASFGLGYAVAAQEHYWEKGKSYIEWQDSILSWPGKADNAGVMTFTGGSGKTDFEVGDLPEGDIAELNDVNTGDAVDADSIVYVNNFNTAVTDDRVSVMTKMDVNYNTEGNNVAAVILVPSEIECEMENTKYFTVLGKGEGSEGVVQFTGENFNPVYTDVENCLIVVVDDTNAGYEAIKNYNVGDTVGLWGFKFNEANVPTDLAYSNAAVYTYDYGTVTNPDDPNGDNSTGDDSNDPGTSEDPGNEDSNGDEGSDGESSIIESSEPETSIPTKDNGNTDNKDDAEEDGGMSPVVIVIIVVVVLAAVAAVVVILMKKKKA